MATAAARAKGGPTKAAAKPRTAKAPEASWSTGQLVFKGNGKVYMNEPVSQKRMAAIWAMIPGLIDKIGPGKYAISIETSA